MDTAVSPPRKKKIWLGLLVILIIALGVGGMRLLVKPAIVSPLPDIEGDSDTLVIFVSPQPSASSSPEASASATPKASTKATPKVSPKPTPKVSATPGASSTASPSASPN